MNENKRNEILAVLVIVLVLAVAYWYFVGQQTTTTPTTTTPTTTPTTTTPTTTTPATTTTPTTATSAPVNLFAATGSNNGVWMMTFSKYYSDSGNINGNGLGSQQQAQALSGAWAVSYSDPSVGGNGQWYAQNKAPSTFASGNGSYYSQFAAPAPSSFVIGWVLPSPKYPIVSNKGMTLTSNQTSQVFQLNSTSNVLVQITALGSGPFVWNMTTNQVVFYDKV